tara:strand:- start:155 stop:1264 length:1110 start_codon:yes stop_codon:yes gene_type:complete
MIITEVEVLHLQIETEKPIQDATIPEPKSDKGTRAQIFVNIHTNEGISGLGISYPAPGVQHVIEKSLKPLLIGQDPLDIEKIWNDMYWHVRGYGRKGIAFCAISAIDIGLWDLKAKSVNLPLYKLLGSYQNSVPIYGSGGWTNFTESELIEEMTSYVSEGIPRVKMKVGKDFGHSEREDIERVAAVRKALGDDVAIYLDANNGYYRKQAIYMAREFENFQVGWLEEPLIPDDIEGMSEVSKSTTIPIATGEHEYTKYGFKDLIHGGGADIVQPDVGRVGGITEWMKVAHLADSFNLPIAPHAMQLVHLHVACATPNLKVVEYMNTSLVGDKVWYTEFPEQENGFWSPYKDKPGLGLELDHYSISKYQIS